MLKDLETYFQVFDSENQFQQEMIRHHLEKLKELDPYLPPNQSFYIVTNTIRRRHEFVSRNFRYAMELDPKTMYQESFDYWYSRFCPQFFEVFMVLLEDMMNFVMTKMSLEDRKKISCSYHIRVRNGKDEYLNIYEQQTPLYFDNLGKPVIGIGYLTILEKHTPQPLIGTIKRLNDNFGYETIYQRNYSKTFLHNQLSNREIDVLRLLAQNRTSKEIGSELFISPHTVDGHRRNLIKKLQLTSTNELVNYCLWKQIF